MKGQALGKIAWRGFAVVILAACSWESQAQKVEAPYTNMAPLERYLMERDAEIKLARSAAPESISGNAAVMVLGRDGYKTAIEGKNGFVCMVQRSWTAGVDDPDFWNPKVRAPICFNPAAMRSQVPLIVRKTEVILASQSKEKMSEAVKTAFDRNELQKPGVGEMCYMMSKDQYLSDRDKQWHPHLMFFVAPAETAAWGANLPGSPVIGVQDPPGELTLFLITVNHWSDGTVAAKE